MKEPLPFGKYLLLERVNVGGMAEVFKAKAFGVEGFERFVAVKRILPSIAEDTEFITMFIDEAKIAVQLTHTNIAQIFDLGKVGDAYFIAMEYVPGKDLRAVFDRARRQNETLPTPMACYVIMKICEGLDYAHNKKSSSGKALGIVHRDVSPQNVLLSYDGEAKLIDFGVAKAAGKAGKTQAGILKGKFSYMSPEQVKGESLDRRSDVFAVGICLYELLTGKRAFLGESDYSTLEKVKNVELVPPSSIQRDIPAELEKIVLKALARKVKDRYQTAMDFHDDLQSFMYTSGNFFSRRDLASYIKATFASDFERENSRNEKYARIPKPATIPSVRLELLGQDGSGVHGSGGPLSTNPGRRKRRRTATPTSEPHPPQPTPPPPPPSPPAAVVAAGGARHAAVPVSTPLVAPLQGPARLPSARSEWDEMISTEIYDRQDEGFSSPLHPVPSPSVDPAQLRGGAMYSFPRRSPPPPTIDPSPPEDRRARRRRRKLEAKQGLSRNQATALTHVRARRPNPWLTGGVFAVALLALALVARWLFAPGEPGTIQFTTTPQDPMVRFDEQPVPALASPFVIPEIEPDVTHLLEVTKPGYRPWSMQIRLQPGQTLVLPPVQLERLGRSRSSDATLGEGTGFVLDTKPSGARIFVDGERIDQRTPARVTDLDPGTHRIRVEHDSHYAPWETQIRIRADEIVELPRAVLTRRSVRVRFRSEPSGAAVTLVRGSEKRSMGVTPTSTDVEITGESWTVEMRLDGHRPWSRELEAPDRDQEEVEVRAELPEAARGGGGVAVVTERPPRRAPRLPAVSGSSSDSPRRAAPRTGSSSPAAAPSAGNGGGASSGETGTLRVNTRPWSEVHIDGKLIGNTPQMNIRLPPGRHQLTLVNEEFNIRENISVIIRPNEVTTKILALNPG